MNKHPSANRHGEGVKAVAKIIVQGKPATVWRDSAKRFAVTFDAGKTSVPPVTFDSEDYSQAVAIHRFKEGSC